jgi:hypothetical protein
MGNGRIGAPNWIEPLWVSFTPASAGAWGTPDTLANLADSDFDNPAISATATPGAIRGDLGNLLTVLNNNQPGIDMLMIPKSNLTTAATVRLKIGTTPFNADGTGGGTVGYDSGVVSAFPAIVYPAGLLPWGHIAGWTGAADPVMDAAYNRCVLIQLPNTVVGLTFWLDVQDPTNPAGFLSLARLFVGPFYTPTQNWSYGAAMQFGGERVADTTASNAEYIDPDRKLKRIMQLVLDDLPEDEMLAIFTGLQFYLGYAKQGAFIFDSADTYHTQRRSFMFTMLKAGDFSYPYFGGGVVPLQIQEVI